MSKYQSAIGSIQNLKNFVQGLTDLSEGLNQLDSIENHVGELERKRDALLIDVKKAQEILDFESDKIQKVQAQSEQAEANAKKDAENILTEAIKQAAAIKVKAQIEADKFKGVVDQAEKEHQLKLTAKSNILADLDSQVEAQQARLDSINKELARIKSL
jgi:cell division septum initiation protein DivIVA